MLPNDLSVPLGKSQIGNASSEWRGRSSLLLDMKKSTMNFLVNFWGPQKTLKSGSLRTNSCLRNCTYLLDFSYNISLAIGVRKKLKINYPIIIVHKYTLLSINYIASRDVSSQIQYTAHAHTKARIIVRKLRIGQLRTSALCRPARVVGWGLSYGLLGALSCTASSCVGYPQTHSLLLA